jgi:hypothetical protein
MKTSRTIKVKIPCVRNPFVALAMKRHAGSHRKSNKAVRRSEKSVALRSD